MQHITASTSNICREEMSFFNAAFDITIPDIISRVYLHRLISSYTNSEKFPLHQAVYDL